MPLNANSPQRAHTAQNVALILLSLFFFPISTFVVLVSLLLRLIYRSSAEKSRRYARAQKQAFVPKRVLVTGVGMSKGLAIARLFYAAGHEVIGADFEAALLPTTCGRVSRALSSFYRLDKPRPGDGGKEYARKLVDIILRERVDLWVSCSGVASALDDGVAKEMVEKMTTCKAVQFDVATTKTFHEKHFFIEHVKSLNLTVPDTHTITSRTQVLDVLEKAQDKKRRYVLKYIGTDDSVRGDMTLLPLATPGATKAHVSRLQISEDRPWILQQYIQGPEYCTHSIVVEGEVKAFVACPSAELLMHYEALPQDSSLSQSMLRFTQEIAAAGGKSFTGHLSFDFLVETAEAELAFKDPTRDVRLYPIECNPRAHTAVVLFNNTPAMADAYLSLLHAVSPDHQPETEGALPNGNSKQPIFPSQQKKYYWMGHDLVAGILSPLGSVFDKNKSSLKDIFQTISTSIRHILFWKDGTFEVWDPWPAWWLYHIYWPTQFLISLVFDRRWSRVNVSTCKMFMC